MEYKDSTPGFKLFLQDVKNDNINNVIVMYGSEQFQIDWAISQLVKKYVSPGWESLDFIQLEEKSVSEQIIEACETSSMLSTRRIICLKDYEFFVNQKAKDYSQQDMNELLSFLDEYQGNNVLIITFCDADPKKVQIKNLIKSFSSYEFGKLEQKDLFSFIQKRFNACNKTISRDNLRFIVNLSGYYNKESQYKLFNMDNDIKKIIALTGEDNKDIKADDINNAMCGDGDSFAFSFIEALSNKQKDKAFTILKNMILNGDSVYQIIGLLANQFELMLEIKELTLAGLNLNQIVSELKGNQYRLTKIFRVNEAFTLEKIKSMLSNIYESDRSIKYGNLDPVTTLEIFIARV